MMAPTKTSVVLVAGSAIKDLRIIMMKIDSLAYDMKMTPYAVFILVRDNDIVPDTVRHDTSPAVVSLLNLNMHFIRVYNITVLFFYFPKY